MPILELRRSAHDRRSSSFCLPILRRERQGQVIDRLKECGQHVLQALIVADHIGQLAVGRAVVFVAHHTEQRLAGAVV